MKKLLTLTIVALIVLFAIPTMVQAVETSAELKSALESDEATVTLDGDITLTEKITISNGKTKVLDLNGKTLTQGSNFIIVENGTLTVKNGKIIADGDAFEVLSKGTAVLNIEADVDVTAGECAVYIKYPGAVLNTAGNLKSIGTEYATIQGNGSNGSGGIVVNIKGGSITSNIEAVYFPNTTELNITGGTITGTTAVYHKSGKLNITGGTLNATGDKVDYVHNPNGCNGTGDALVIEASDYPGGVPEVSISGGIFTSKNNKAVGYYKQAENYKLANEKFISGGSFSSDVEEYIDDSLVSVEENGVFYVGEEHDIKVEKTENGTVKASLEKAVQGQTVELTVTPNEGYKLKSLTVITSADSKVEVKDNKFTMPDLGVIVNAEFEKISTTSGVAGEEKDETPKTGSIDVVLYASAIIATISLAGIVLVKKYTK